MSVVSVVFWLGVSLFIGGSLGQFVIAPLLFGERPFTRPDGGSYLPWRN